MKTITRKFALALVLMGLAFAALNLARPSVAHAGPVPVGMLVTDGGTAASTNTLCLPSANGTIIVQSVTGVPVAVRTFLYDGGSQTVSTTTDYRPWTQATTTSTDDAGLRTTSSTVTVPLSWGPVEMGPDRCITARALDGGDPFLTVFKVTKNGP